MHKFLLLSLVLAALGGCKSNPYPGGEVSSFPQRIPEAVKPAIGINVEDILPFNEGAEGRHDVIVNVPEGNAIVQWTGLPAEAVYNQAENTLSWKPSYTDGNDPSDFSVKGREYLATITLRSDVDRVTSIKKTVVLKVKDVPRKFAADVNFLSGNIIEGETTDVATITLDSLDFPQGPFQLGLKDGQKGLTLVPSADPTIWTIKAGPFGFNTIKAGTCSHYYCSMDMTEIVSVFTPDGRKSESKISFSLRDVRQDAVVSLPSKVEVRGDLDLIFTALDPNEEIAPQVRIVTGPSVGKLELLKSPELTASAYEARYLLSWTQIPQEANGQTYNLALDVCNSSLERTLNYESCKRIRVELKVSPRDVIFPQVTRGNWETSELKYLKMNKTFSHSIELKPGAGARILSKKVIPSDGNEVVDYSNGYLTIQPKSPGIKFVTVKLTNNFGSEASETFMYEVLPADWSSNVLLGFAGDVPEFSTMESLLPNSNREFGAPQGPRTLTDRKQVFAGTHTMSFTNGATELSYYAANLKNVFIATPKLASLPTSLTSELRSHGVYLAGRTADVAGFNLKDFELTPTRDLGLPTGVTGLAGVTTSESLNPGLLSMTLSSDCTRLFALFKPGPTPAELLAGVSCPRSNGGRLVVLGFEWADIRVSQPDADLPKKWFEKVTE